MGNLPALNLPQTSSMHSKRRFTVMSQDCGCICPDHALSALICLTLTHNFSKVNVRNTAVTPVLRLFSTLLSVDSDLNIAAHLMATCSRERREVARSTIFSHFLLCFSISPRPKHTVLVQMVVSPNTIALAVLYMNLCLETVLVLQIIQMFFISSLVWY